MLCYSRNTCATIFHQRMDICCHVCHYCAFAGSDLDKTIDDFSPLVAYTAPSGNMRASEHGGGFLVSVNVRPSFSVTSAHGVFNNRVSPSSPGGQPRAIAIVCIVRQGSKRTCFYSTCPRGAQSHPRILPCYCPCLCISAKTALVHCKQRRF